MVLHLLTIAAIASVVHGSCLREPEGWYVPRTSGDGDFRIKIGGEPNKYVPGSIYTITLIDADKRSRPFVGFSLVVEPLDPLRQSTPQVTGSFQLFGDEHTAFNWNCVNTIMHSHRHPMNGVQVLWTAPPPGSGCLVFRATVEETDDIWYMDDGSLSLEICELKDEPEDVELTDQGAINEPCCACDDAKYEMIFEGIWSKETHPRDFPFNVWLTHFSDVIGASHISDFRFWEEGGIASEGLRQIAEWGSVRSMENELRAQSKNLRTIIKSAGLWYPNVNANTTSSFRVDRKHHLVSLVSMLGPTPDWIVGVSGQELCLKNCSWVYQKIVDLYPWDAGTDSGITYMSPNSPTTPRDPIRRITETDPADTRNPFFETDGKKMLPLARLYLTRQKVYERSCSDQVPVADDDVIDIAENTEDAERPECAVNAWSPWSQCSVSCGKGIRMRQRTYVMPTKAEMMGCDRQLVSKEMCVADIPSCGDDDEDDIPIEAIDEGVCQVSDWGPWSQCSATCGKGFTMRTRRFLDRMGRKKCHHVSIAEKDVCMSDIQCEEEQAEENNPLCRVTEWSEWSPCSASCGRGLRFRSRIYLVSDVQHCNVELMQKQPCTGEIAECGLTEDDAKEACLQEKETGPCRGYFPRWHFDPKEDTCVQFIYGGCRGNRNNFNSYLECSRICAVVRGLGLQTNNTSQGFQFEDENAEDHLVPGDSPVVDCMVTPWSEWTACSATCGKSRKERRRMIKVHPLNGGKSCPKKLIKRKKCQVPHCN